MKTTPSVVTLRPDQRTQLNKLIRSGTSPARVQTHARILLLAATHDGGPAPDTDTGRVRTKEEIATILSVSPRTVMRVCGRFLVGGLDAALYDRPRRGRPPEITGEVEAKVTMLACSEPPAGHARWTLRLLAQKMVELVYSEHISHTAVRKVLKKTNCALGPSRAGASAK